LRKTSLFTVILFFLLLLSSGCAYRYYLGMHGPSIQRSPEIHADVSADAECLECHHPARNPKGPPTSHPQFMGCLKCHNDPL
jgi:hypothetical protein